MKKLNITNKRRQNKAVLMSRKTNPINKYKTIMFDLDGTLLETHHAIIPCFKKVCQQLNIDIEGRDLTEFIGPPLYDSYLSLTNSPAAAQIATDLYRKLYDEEIWIP
jgi:Predicted phosphatases